MSTMTQSPRAVVLLSGGMDSTTVLAHAQQQGYACYALSFDYGQKQVAELQAAAAIAKAHAVVEHRIINIRDLGQLVQSALTDQTIAVPDHQPGEQIPCTYVPARNTVLLAIALGWAEVLSAYDLFIGVSAIDYSNYPDCRPEYINAFQALANLATKAGVEGKQGLTVHTPLIHLSKAETVQLGVALGVDYQQTVSCYQADGEGRACGRCDACQLRKKGFEEAQVLDPTRYYVAVE